MMRQRLYAAAFLALFSTSHAIAMPFAGAGFVPAPEIIQVKDRFSSPPIDPNLPPVTDQSINTEMDDEIKQRFAEAAGSASGLLTVQQAKNASWGFVADRFAAIDRNHDGYIRLSDVQDFIQSGSGGGEQIPAGPKSIQIIE